MENTGSLAVAGEKRWRGFDTIKVFSPSSHELGRSSRRGIMSPRDINPCKRGAPRQAAARDILSRGVHSVLVKRGTNGSLLIDRDGEVNLQPIFEVDKV